MTTKKPSEHGPNAELAPFYVAGTLPADEAARFKAKLARDPDLARNVEAARAERDEVLALNEALPTPSAHSLEKLFGLIDAEPARKPSLWSRLDIGSALAEMFSPRALGWAAAAACLLVSVEAGILTLQPSPKPVDGYATASRTDTVTQGGAFALIAFSPKANAEAVSALLAETGVQIVEGPRAGGFYRIRLGGPDVPTAETRRRLDALRQATAVVRFAETSP